MVVWWCKSNCSVLLDLGLLEKNFSSKLEFKLFFLKLGLSNKMRSFFTIFLRIWAVIANYAIVLLFCISRSFIRIFSIFFILTIFLFLSIFASVFSIFLVHIFAIAVCRNLISYHFILTVNFCLFFPNSLHFGIPNFNGLDIAFLLV